ncbi:inner membrane protein AmpE [Alcanivorax hongdengensis A-11-3]|uniref:Inner membrane protein AmpE n=1 Tax=Alcanivorax hongdengensis A-11-3 TaxID=1177179 RepID=L0WDK8_9GAMM|nr:protein AmpE [Alcanivorax hongdengensis]EKF74242.1 inner membrane protein AmpE [Alcanivorax hongdengensis A-11-3]
MKILLLLVVLGLRRLDIHWPAWLMDEQRHDRWLQAWAARFGQGMLLWWLAVVLPSVLLTLLFAYGDSIGFLLLLLVPAGILLLWLLGAQSEFRYVDELLVRGHMNDSQGFADLAADEFGISGSTQTPDYFPALTARILEREMRLFAAIFWLMTLGFGALTFYLLNRVWLNRQEQSDSRLRDLQAILDGIPRQLLVLCMALAGNFSAVMSRMNGHWWRQDKAAPPLDQIVLVALDDAPGKAPVSLPEGMEQLEALQGLLLRCMAIWLILAALWVVLV